jgi:hypothetical protein
MNLRYPERLLQPWKDLRQFTQELYAMYRAGSREEPEAPASPPSRPRAAPAVARRPSVRRESGPDGPTPSPPSRPEAGSEPPRWATVARRVRAVEAGRRVETVAEERRREAATPVRFPEPGRGRRPEAPPADPGPARRAAPGPEPEPPPARDRPGPVDTPRPEFTAAEVGRRPEEARPYRPPYEVVNVGADLDEADFTLPIGGGGTTVFVGKVVSGSGDTYQVRLYQAGPDGDPDEDPVEVTIPTIDPAERIPADTWLFGVFQFQDADGDDTYYAQPPIWLT